LPLIYPAVFFYPQMAQISADNCLTRRREGAKKTISGLRPEMGWGEV
jgi:hypothetical protein